MKKTFTQVINDLENHDLKSLYSTVLASEYFAINSFELETSYEEYLEVRKSIDRGVSSRQDIIRNYNKILLNLIEVICSVFKSYKIELSSIESKWVVDKDNRIKGLIGQSDIKNTTRTFYELAFRMQFPRTTMEFVMHGGGIGSNLLFSLFHNRPSSYQILDTYKPIISVDSRLAVEIYLDWYFYQIENNLIKNIELNLVQYMRRSDVTNPQALYAVQQLYILYLCSLVRNIENNADKFSREKAWKFCLIMKFNISYLFENSNLNTIRTESFLELFNRIRMKLDDFLSRINSTPEDIPTTK